MRLEFVPSLSKFEFFGSFCGHGPNSGLSSDCIGKVKVSPINVKININPENEQDPFNPNLGKNPAWNQLDVCDFGDRCVWSKHTGNKSVGLTIKLKILFIFLLIKFQREPSFLVAIYSAAGIFCHWIITTTYIQVSFETKKLLNKDTYIKASTELVSVDKFKCCLTTANTRDNFIFDPAHRCHHLLRILSWIRDALCSRSWCNCCLTTCVHACVGLDPNQTLQGYWTLRETSS